VEANAHADESANILHVTDGRTRTQL